MTGETVTRWKTVTDNAVTYYQRVTDHHGARLIAELHFGVGEGHVAAAIHHYVEPDGHTGADLDGCQVRASTPGRALYDQWIVAGRDDEAAYQLLADADVPAAVPPVPQHAQAQIELLQRQLAATQQQLDRQAAVQRVKLNRRR